MNNKKIMQEIFEQKEEKEEKEHKEEKEEKEEKKEIIGKIQKHKKRRKKNYISPGKDILIISLLKVIQTTFYNIQDTEAEVEPIQKEIADVDLIIIKHQTISKNMLLGLEIQHKRLQRLRTHAKRAAQIKFDKQYQKHSLFVTNLNHMIDDNSARQKMATNLYSKLHQYYEDKKQVLQDYFNQSGFFNCVVCKKTLQCKCGNHAFVPRKKCSHCQVVYYCSKKCQKIHWNVAHRYHCQELFEVFLGKCSDELYEFVFDSE